MLQITVIWQFNFIICFKKDIGDAMSGYYVWAVQDNKAVRKDIKVSDDINNNWIVEDGLNKSDVIVVSGIQNVAAEGQKLKIITNQSEK